MKFCANRFRPNAFNRTAMTLVELIVVMTIIAIAISLIIPAVQVVRAAAERIESINQVKNILVAVHDFSTEHGGTLPGCSPDSGTTFEDIMNLMDNSIQIFRPTRDGRHAQLVGLTVTRNPADPSYAFYPDESGLVSGNSSYGFNAVAFSPNSNVSRSFPDGTSNTIAIAEHYARCAEKSLFSRWIGFQSQGTRWVGRPATFADVESGDVIPVVDRKTHYTIGSIPGKTFQVAPLPKDCDPMIPQTPHLSGMITGFMDGSVRPISGLVSPRVFWSAATPAGGEVVDLDW